MKLPVRRGNVGQKDIAIGVWVQRSNAGLVLAIPFQETPCFDLDRMDTQRFDATKIEVEPESLVAIAIYTLIGWGIVSLIRLLTGPSSSTTVVE